MKALLFFKKWAWLITIILFGIGIGIFLSIPSEVRVAVRKDKATIKKAEQTLKREKQKVAAFQDTIEGKDKKIARLTVTNKVYAAQDSLIQLQTRQDVGNLADISTSAAASRWLNNYVSPDSL